MRLRILILSALCLLGLVGCGLVKNTSPASYIADVVTYGEGYQAFVCYFVLADRSGAETASTGTARLRVMDGSTTIFSTRYTIAQSDFRTVTVGQGAFERKRLICSLGRIPYSRFSSSPTSFSGTVHLTFTTESGNTLEGRDTLFFDSWQLAHLGHMQHTSEVRR